MSVEVWQPKNLVLLKKKQKKFTSLGLYYKKSIKLKYDKLDK